MNSNEDTKLSAIWPRQPFVGLALAALFGILIAEATPHPSTGLVALGLSAPLAFVRKSSLATCAFVLACFFYLHSLRQTNSPGLRLAQELGEMPQAVTATGVVVSEPNVSARGTASFLFQFDSITLHDQTLVSHATISARWRHQVRFGDELQLFGVVQRVEGPRNPGEFDMRAYLARRDIRYALLVRDPENGRILKRGGGSRIMRAALDSRAWMQAALARGLDDSPDLHGLISGMVLGVRDQTPDEIQEQFQETGTLHLFAVSGLNVAILAQLLWMILRGARVPRRWAIALIIPALFFYAAVTGLNASSIRAALMAAVLLGGFFVDRKVLATNSVAAAAVLVLCWDTNQLFSTGFQLSFAVVIAIIVLAEPLYGVLVRWCEPDPFLPQSLLSRRQRSWQWIWSAIAKGSSVSLAAWIGSLPLILPYFYLVTPVSLLANLVVVPIAFFVLAVGLMSLLVISFAPWLAVIFNNANWSLAAAILWAVGLFARAPGGHFYLALPHWPTGALAEITVLDAGTGAAVHLRTGRSDWLFDAGPARDFKRVVRPYLRSRGINGLDGIVLSHGDAAHIGATVAMMRAFHPLALLDTAAPDRSRVHKELIAHLAEMHFARRFCGAGDHWKIGKDVVARVLFPPAEYQASNADDQALVVQLTIAGRWRVLLLSDSGEATERLLLAGDADLRSDILIKGQHHSGVSGSLELLERAQPAAIVASSVAFPQNESVKHEWEEVVSARQIKLFRQDRTGAVTLRFFQDHWEVKPFLQPETFRNPAK